MAQYDDARLDPRETRHGEQSLLRVRTGSNKLVICENDTVLCLNTVDAGSTTTTVSDRLRCCLNPQPT